MTKQNLLVYAVIALLFGVTGAYVGANKKNAAAPLTTVVAPNPDGPHAPVSALFAQSLPDAQGVPRQLGQWKGKALIVNFWAPWCAPCVEEMPELAALAAEKSGATLQVIGIGIDSPANIKDFAAKFKIGYPLYVAGLGGTELARQFGNSAGGLPFTVLIGADGQVRKTYLGRLEFSRLRADLAALER